MRQLTGLGKSIQQLEFSKLPMRQLTVQLFLQQWQLLSKLPMRQLTKEAAELIQGIFSKLPMRQLTMLERKKKPTARALIHLFPTLTQIYSCLEIY